jgi:hypothetical protein
MSAPEGGCTGLAGSHTFSAARDAIGAGTAAGRAGGELAMRSRCASSVAPECRRGGGIGGVHCSELEPDSESATRIARKRRRDGVSGPSPMSWRLRLMGLGPWSLLGVLLSAVTNDATEDSAVVRIV